MCLFVVWLFVCVYGCMFQVFDCVFVCVIAGVFACLIICDGVPLCVTCSWVLFMGVRVRSCIGYWLCVN